jgi:hypothetical protein
MDQEETFLNLENTRNWDSMKERTNMKEESTYSRERI